MKHGHWVGGKPSPEYRTWDSMIGRCERPCSASFKHYGARGIKVCKRWRRSFAAFLQDMGPRPSLRHQIERKDSNGNYTPKNCTWATAKEQARNRSSNHRLTFDGHTLSEVEWAERTGLPRHTIITRIARGWSVARALTTARKSYPLHVIRRRN